MRRVKSWSKGGSRATATSPPWARSPQSQVPALTQHTQEHRPSQGPCVFQDQPECSAAQQEGGERCAAETAGASPAPAERPAEWTRSGGQGRGEVRSDLEEGQRRAQIGEGRAGAARSGCGRSLAGREGRATDAIWGDRRQGCNQGGLHGGTALPALHLVGLSHYCPQSGGSGGEGRGGERHPEALESGGIVRGSRNCMPWSPHLQSTLFKAHKSGFLNSSLTAPR